MLREVRLRCPAISRWVEFCYSNPARLYYGEHTLWSCQGVQQGDPLGPLLFSLVLHPLICKIRDSFSLSLHAWYLDDGTIVGDTVVVGKVLELIMEDGPGCGLHLNVDKTEVFWPKEDPRSRLAGIFPPNIARPLHGVKLLGGPASVDFDFCNELVMKRVAKTIGLMDAIAKINDPQCELLLLRSCTGISRLYFTMRTCPPRVFESAQRSFDVALRSSLERIVTASGPGFGDWQWRLATLPFAFGGLGVYSAGDVLNYAFLASRLQSAGLQTKLLRHTSIVSPGPIFDEALSVFNTSMETDLLSNPSEIATTKLMKKMDHTSDWLRTVIISGLGQTINACSRVFAGDIYGDHVVSCAGIIGIKHRHNIVRDTLVDICYRSGISAGNCFRSGISVGKEVDIGQDGGCDKLLHPTYMLLYSRDGGLDVCVDLTRSSPLTQTEMADFVPGRAVIEVVQRKRVKYMAKCAAIGYEFFPFSFSSLGELEEDAITLLKRIRKFSMAQDIGACAAVHIFNRISFVIPKGVRAQIVSHFPFNLL
ncbi:zinc finger, CCHC-type containing protein [Tanacetum coccineum]|uniref:Zinc finger, CCHC-type containing protein n=1 Tax=Tanacetum coccineum TaxID=301880 RepID=A0ABQ5GZZ8_9ASTR